MQTRAPDEHPEIIIINNAEMPDTETQPLHHTRIKLCCDPIHALNAALWAGPLGSAIFSASQYAINLKSNHFHLSIIILGPSIAFLTSLGLSKTFTLGGIEDVDNFIKSSFHIPNEWPKISIGQEIFALTTGAIISILYSAINATQAYAYFDKTIPTYFDITDKLEPHQSWWDAGSATISGIVILNLLLGKGISSYKTIRHILSTERYQYHNQLSSIVSPLFGRSFGCINAATTMLSNFQGVRQVLKIKDTPVLYAVGSGIVLSSFADLSSNNVFLMKSINQLIAYLSDNKPTRGEVSAFLLALAAASTLAYPVWSLTHYSFNNLINSLDTHHLAYDWLAPALSGIHAISSIPVNTATLYPMADYLITHTSNAISSFSEFVCCYFNSNADTPEDEQSFLENHNEILQANNPHRLFSRSINNEPNNDFMIHIDSEPEPTHTATILI